jgi:molecular chaperone GrpE
MNHQSQHHQPEQQPVVVRDKRRIDPVTLQPRSRGADSKPAEPRPPAGPGSKDVPGAGLAGEPPTRRQPDGPAETEELRAQIQERTADLQRLKAEYDNYRKRVQRDRLAVREIAVVNVLARLLPVLDSIDAAREHGEVTGGFQQVAEALERQLSALGLESCGREGDTFDPALHEAVSHAETDLVDRATCAAVHRPGYRVGEHLLRPAQVTVAEPPAQAPTETDTGKDRPPGTHALPGATTGREAVHRRSPRDKPPSKPRAGDLAGLRP